MIKQKSEHPPHWIVIEDDEAKPVEERARFKLMLFSDGTVHWSYA